MEQYNIYHSISIKKELTTYTKEDGYYFMHRESDSKKEITKDFYNRVSNEVEDQERIHIGFVYTDSLENAFKLSQNLDNVWNTMDPCRSTSVGDVIECREGFYMVCSSGFRLLDVMSRNESELNALENQSLEC